jgi:hypothetical protein
MNAKTIILTLSLPAILSGCAYYDITPIAATETSKWAMGTPPSSDGYIIYQPELYFSATVTVETTKDDKGKEQTKENVSVTPLYLPNYQKPYRVTTHNFLAKADFAFEFENGWKLTKLSDKSDNSTIANTLAGELKTMLSASGLAIASENGKKKRRVIMYRPEFNSQTGYFESFKQVASIEEDDPAKPGK